MTHQQEYDKILRHKAKMDAKLAKLRKRHAYLEVELEFINHKMSETHLEINDLLCDLLTRWSVE